MQRLTGWARQVRGGDLSLVEIKAPKNEIGVLNDSFRGAIKSLRAANAAIGRQTGLTSAINKVFREALTCETVEDLAKTALRVAEELTDSKFGFIGEINAAGLMDTIAINNPGWEACDIVVSDAKNYIKDMPLRGIDRSTLREGKSRIVNADQIETHPDRVGMPQGHPPITSFLGVPLKHAGKTIGMIGLGNKESGYDLSDQQTIEALSVAFVEALMHKRVEKAFEAEQEKFRALVEESPLGVSLIGEDGVYKYVNPRFVELFGYSLKDIPDGREWFRKAHPDPEYRTQVISEWLNDMKKTKESEGSSYTWSVVCKDGSKKVIQFVAVSMETGDHLVIYEDLTKQKKLEAQFRQSQKMEGIGRLAGGIAHDFNNLLTTIIGYTDITLMKIDKESPLRSGMEEIKKASDRAANLTSQLLAFSRKQMIQPVVLNINYPLAEMDKMLRRLIGEHIDLITILEPELWKVKFDPGHLDQVVMNLAVNAKDAMPNGGKLTIETTNVDLDEAYARQHGVELKPGPFVMVAVSDTGMGMDEEIQSHIFEPFFTTKETGKGTGLGLSMVYGIVKQSGGFIWVYSEPGQGTTFKIYLPAIVPHSETQARRAGLPKVEAEEEFAEEEQTQPQNLEGSETILLAEDDDSLRELVRSILQKYGYSFLEAQDGKEALRLSEQHEGPIHLLLTDVVMPGMSGRELADRLQPLQPKMRVLYMSGYTDNAIVHHGVLESGIQFIQKPFTPKVLVSKVRMVLDT
ncbi:MAG: ATP-binding protein [Pseudomonadota bacterium]